MEYSPTLEDDAEERGLSQIVKHDSSLHHI